MKFLSIILLFVLVACSNNTGSVDSADTSDLVIHKPKVIYDTTFKHIQVIVADTLYKHKDSTIINYKIKDSTIINIVKKTVIDYDTTTKDTTIYKITNKDSIVYKIKYQTVTKYDTTIKHIVINVNDTIFHHKDSTVIVLVKKYKDTTILNKKYKDTTVLSPIPLYVPANTDSITVKYIIQKK